jgi:hypothetical protein
MAWLGSQEIEGLSAEGKGYHTRRVQYPPRVDLDFSKNKTLQMESLLAGGKGQRPLMGVSTPKGHRTSENKRPS